MTPSGADEASNGPTDSIRPAASTTTSPSSWKADPPAASGVRTRARIANGGRSGSAAGEGWLAVTARDPSTHSGSGCQDVAVERLDILIRGGSLVDGTGAPARTADVGVASGRLRTFELGTEPPTADRTIDATGKVVAPGFIDLHSHSGLMILAEPN